VAERHLSLMARKQAAWKDERGEKNTGGRRWSQGASQRPWRLPQRRLLGRVIDIMRMVPCGQGACGVTFPGSRCKSFVWPVLCGERVPSLPLLASKATHQRRHPPWSWAMADCACRRQYLPAFSVVRLRSDGVLVSEEHPMKTSTHPRLWTTLSLPAILCGATDQGPPPRA
jgi:hypothetical protein